MASIMKSLWSRFAQVDEFLDRFVVSLDVFLLPPALCLSVVRVRNFLV